ncbi:MAG: peroxiredoxin [Ignavibacteriaceae bacterium]|nr:peroxiredoxin [Ignavibacteriaceae bacterium]
MTSRSNSLPLIGELMPEIAAATTVGPINLREHYQGKWILLFSHPADFTPVCTTEFVAFARKSYEFKNLNCELIALSIDQVFSHIKWVEWIKQNIGVDIEFPIIADELGEIAQSLGMIHYVKATNTVRAVFIIGPDYKLRLMMYYPQEIGRQVDEILRALKALQIAEQYSVSMPENWPNNELIGDKVILPPPNNIEEARERIKNTEGYDWWFTYKDLK